jgi:hypothetical protein
MKAVVWHGLWLSEVEEMHTVIDAYHALDERQPGWLKVELVPGL